MKQLYTLLFMFTIQSAVANDAIIYLANHHLFRYHPQLNETTLLSVDKSYDLSNYKIGSIMQKNDSLMLTVCRKELENGDSFLSDVEFLIEKDSCIFVRSHKIQLIGGGPDVWVAKVERIDARGTVSHYQDNSFSLWRHRHYFESWGRWSDPYNQSVGSDPDGNLFIVKEGGLKEILFYGRKTEKGATCGYIDPDRSSDGRYIVCAYACFKYTMRKRISYSPLMEYDTHTKSWKKLFIQGYQPRYAKSGHYILFRIKEGEFVVYDRMEHVIVATIRADQVYWCDLSSFSDIIRN
jgi:hypothetical protein